jgi:hypothetical protein
MKFASSMNRKDYTYTFTGQIIEVNNKRRNFNKKIINKNNITSLTNKL